MVAPAAIFASVAQAQSEATAASANTNRATYNAGDRFIPHFYRATAVLVGGRRALRPGVLLADLEGPDAAASGHERAREIGALERHRPLRLAGEGIHGPQIAAAIGIIE